MGQYCGADLTCHPQLNPGIACNAQSSGVCTNFCSPDGTCCDDTASATCTISCAPGSGAPTFVPDFEPCIIGIAADGGSVLAASECDTDLTVATPLCQGGVCGEVSTACEYQHCIAGTCGPTCGAGGDVATCDDDSICLQSQYGESVCCSYGDPSVIYVADNGADEACCGWSPQVPCQTLTYAFASGIALNASRGAMPITFSVIAAVAPPYWMSPEAWPLAIPGGSVLSAPGVSFWAAPWPDGGDASPQAFFEVNSALTTTLEGTPGAPVIVGIGPGDGGTAVAALLVTDGGSALVSNCTLTGSGIGLRVESGSVLSLGNDVTGNGVGYQLAGGSAFVDGGTVTCNGIDFELEPTSSGGFPLAIEHAALPLLPDGGWSVEVAATCSTGVDFCLAPPLSASELTVSAVTGATCP